jgi:RNA-directed DNA polymerase
MEIMLMEFAKSLDMRRNDKPNSQVSWQQKVKSLTFKWQSSLLEYQNGAQP